MYDYVLLLRVTWKLTDIDYPACLSHVEFDYYDTVYNESISKQVGRSIIQPTIDTIIAEVKIK